MTFQLHTTAKRGVIKFRPAKSDAQAPPTEENAGKVTATENKSTPSSSLTGTRTVNERSGMEEHVHGKDTTENT